MERIARKGLVYLPGEEALGLHQRYPVVDGHNDSILAAAAGRRTLVATAAEGHLDFPRARAAGLAAAVCALWPEPASYPLALVRVLQLHDRLRAAVAAAAPAVRLATAPAAVAAAHAEGALAVVVAVEGGEALHGEVAVLRTLYRLGVRVLGLTWNHRNALADGALEDAAGGGLSRFGQAVVAEMNRLGMVIDTAHLAPRSFYAVLERSADPVVFSHGNCRALFDHPRNLDDAQIRALAAAGGVMGVSFVSAFMAAAGQRGNIATVADHIDHVCQVTGSAAHAALGSDFDGTDTVPAGLDDVTGLPQLTAELLRRGYGEADLAQILGGNYLRVWQQVLREAGDVDAPH